MRVVLLHNPRSGKARSAAAVEALHAVLRADGHDVESVRAGADLPVQALAAALTDAEALIVAGGDGSVHHAAPALMAARGREPVPVYHYPLGTENLFARECGTRADPGMVLRCLRNPRVRPMDVGLCDGRPFVLMASFGFDAAVVGRVAARRQAGVRRADYLRAAMAEWRDHRPPSFTIEADGSVIAREEPGLLIVANSEQYAARLDPCAGARCDDGVLDVLFMRYRSRRGIAGLAAALALGMHARLRGATRTRAAEIRVLSDGQGAALQLDGERIASAPRSVHITVAADRLRALSPDPP